MGIGYTRGDLNRIATGGLGPLREARGRRRGGLAGTAMDNLASRGVVPPGYYGRGDGKYMGFDTQGQLQDYYAGRGRILDEWAEETGMNLLDEAGAGYDRLSAEEARARAAAYDTLSSGMPTYGEVPELAANIDESVQDPFFTGLGITADDLKDRRVMRSATVTTPGHPTRFKPNDRPMGATGMDVALGGTWAPQRGRMGEGVSSGRIFKAPAGQGYIEPVQFQSATPDSVDFVGQRLWDQNVSPDQQSEYDAYIAGLEKFVAKQAGSIAETAAQAGDFMGPTPTEWAQQVAISEGLDPSLAAEWYGPERELADQRRQIDLARMPLDEFNTDQDLQALEMGYGSWAEYQQALEDAYGTQQDEAKTAAEAADEAARRQFTTEVFDITGMGPDDLAQAADVPVDAIPDILVSDTYKSYVDTIYGMLSEEGADPYELNNVLYQLTREGFGDVARVLAAQFGLPPLDYDFGA